MKDLLMLMFGLATGICMMLAIRFRHNRSDGKIIQLTSDEMERRRLEDEHKRQLNELMAYRPERYYEQ